MKEVELKCDSCGYIGELSFNPDEFNEQDICACPFCGADVDVSEDE